MRPAASLPVPPDLAMCRRVAERVEALGYDSVWIADTGAGPDAFVVGAAVATCTTRPAASCARDPAPAAMTDGVRVYTGITAVPIRSRVVQVATAAPTTNASGPAPVSAIQTLS